jgi:hypothetical protein
MIRRNKNLGNQNSVMTNAASEGLKKIKVVFDFLK